MAPAVGQQPHRFPAGPQNVAQANEAAARRAEARRIDNVSRQIAAVEQMKRAAGANAYPARAVYYDAPVVLANGTLASYRPVWGYYRPRAVEQPIGQREVQTGPNRWESFPIYASDLVPPPFPGPAVGDAPAPRGGAPPRPNPPPPNRPWPKGAVPPVPPLGG